MPLTLAILGYACAILGSGTLFGLILSELG